MWKNYESDYRFGIDIHSYFHATCALLKDFEILDHFSHIFKSFSTPKCGYDPVKAKN